MRLVPYLLRDRWWIHFSERYFIQSFNATPLPSFKCLKSFITSPLTHCLARLGIFSSFNLSCTSAVFNHPSWCQNVWCPLVWKTSLGFFVLFWFVLCACELFGKCLRPPAQAHAWIPQKLPRMSPCGCWGKFLAHCVLHRTWQLLGLIKMFICWVWAATHLPSRCSMDCVSRDRFLWASAEGCRCWWCLWRTVLERLL